MHGALCDFVSTATLSTGISISVRMTKIAMLAVVAEEYRNDPKGYNEDHSVEELKSMLRWSIPDWGYYGFFHSAAEG